MSIKLADGTYTRKQAIDHRLRRLVQIVQDTIGKPLSECRVLDLACLEGHYAVEFALHGAEVVGIEGRQISLDKCNYAKNSLGLSRLSFFTDDVLNLSIAKYGKFDVVICSGILYHLTASNAVKFIKSISEVCTKLLLLDTFISLGGRTAINVDGISLHGHHYSEHEDTDSANTKASRLWASIDNTTSFWFTEATLGNLLIRSGFSSVSDILSPTMPYNPRDRKTYLAIRGQKTVILSSDMTNDGETAPFMEGVNRLMDSSQMPRSAIFKAAKRLLPQSIKNVIKPALRAARILPPDTTPEFMKKEH